MMNFDRPQPIDIQWTWFWHDELDNGGTPTQCAYFVIFYKCYVYYNQ